MNRDAKKMLISAFLGILFFFSLVVVTDIYSSDQDKEKTLVLIQNDAKFGEERIIIITEYEEEAARANALIGTINPNPLPPPPDTLN